MKIKQVLIIFSFLIIKSLYLYPQYTADTVFISTVKELKNLSHNVNNGTNYQGKVVQLTQDIFLNDTTGWQRWDSVPMRKKEQWTPIGHLVDKDSIMAFQGIFDGKGYSIYGLYIDRGKNGVFQGLFGAIKNSTIKNLSIKASVIIGYTYVGGIVAYAGDLSVIENCHNFSKITGIRNKVGGIVAVLNTESSSSVINCSNSGCIKGKCIIGGIVGYAQIHSRKKKEKKKKSCGMAIYNCFNKGEIAGYRDIGGIMGSYLAQTGNHQLNIIANCFNIGNIHAQYVAGGICGTYKLFNNNHIKFSSFSNCYNAGIVSITYSTSTDFLIGDLHSFAYNRKIEKAWTNNSFPCFFTMPKGAQHLRTRELTPFALSWTVKSATIKVSAPSHFHTLTPEEMQSDTFVDKLNLFVKKHPGPYKKWEKDTKAINKGFPIFTE